MVSASFFSAFGNSALMLPLGLATAALLWLQGRQRFAIHWTVLTGIGMGLVATSKVMFFGWGVGVRPIDLTCISGHTFLATAIWPVLIGAAWPVVRWRAAAIGAGLVLAGLVGTSRVLVGAHSVSEVLAGWLVGGLVLAVAIRIGGAELPGLSLRHRQYLGGALALSGVLMAPALQARGLPSETWLEKTAVVLSGAATPMTRHRWHRPQS